MCNRSGKSTNDLSYCNQLFYHFSSSDELHNFKAVCVYVGGGDGMFGAVGFLGEPFPCMFFIGGTIQSPEL